MAEKQVRLLKLLLSSKAKQITELQTKQVTETVTEFVTEEVTDYITEDSYRSVSGSKGQHQDNDS